MRYPRDACSKTDESGYKHLVKFICHIYNRRILDLISVNELQAGDHYCLP